MRIRTMTSDPWPQVDSCVPITAWRGWLVWGDDRADGSGHVIRLGSVPKLGYIWPPLTAPPAQCRREGVCAGPPRLGCTCGYYGLDAPVFAARSRRLAATPFVIVGKVHLWGRVIVCASGWKAEYAYPAELLIPTDVGWAPDRLEEISRDLRDYGVPARPMKMEEVMHTISTAARGKART